MSTTTEQTPVDDAADNVPRRLLKIDQVRRMTGLSTSFIYEKMAQGEFPAAVRLGKGIAVAWRESEVDALISFRPRATRPGAPVRQAPATAAERQQDGAP